MHTLGFRHMFIQYSQKKQSKNTATAKTGPKNIHKVEVWANTWLWRRLYPQRNAVETGSLSYWNVASKWLQSLWSFVALGEVEECKSKRTGTHSQPPHRSPNIGQNNLIVSMHREASPVPQTVHILYCQVHLSLCSVCVISTRTDQIIEFYEKIFDGQWNPDKWSLTRVKTCIEAS